MLETWFITLCRLLTLCLLGTFACFFLSSADFFSSKSTFREFILGIQSECQTVWIKISVLSGLIWIQTVYKGGRQSALAGKELRRKYMWFLCLSHISEQRRLKRAWESSESAHSPVQGLRCSHTHSTYILHISNIVGSLYFWRIRFSRWKYIILHTVLTVYEQRSI